MIRDDFNANTITTNLTLHRNRDEQRQQQGDKTSFLHTLWSLVRCIILSRCKVSTIF